MAEINDIGQKIENKGATAAGRLSAAEFNTILNQIIQNVSDIASLRNLKAGWAEISTSGDTTAVTFYNFKNGSQLFSGSVASASGLADLHTTVDTHTQEIADLQTKDADIETSVTTNATDIQSVESRVEALESRTGSSALVCVITGYNLASLVGGGYTADELKEIASLLYSASGNVILMKSKADTSDSQVNGYTLIAEDSQVTNVTARTQARTYHYDTDTEAGSFTLSVASSGTWSVSSSSRGRISSEYVADSDETADEVLSVLSSSDETEETEETNG